MSELMNVEDIKKGEYVRKIKLNPQDGYEVIGQSKTYIRGAYEPSLKKYSLIDFDDTSREVFVKKGTQLLVEFTF